MVSGGLLVVMPHAWSGNVCPDHAEEELLAGGMALLGRWVRAIAFSLLAALAALAGVAGGLSGTSL
jgi:hypothetical protein